MLHQIKSPDLTVGAYGVGTVVSTLDPESQRHPVASCDCNPYYWVTVPAGNWLIAVNICW